MKKIFTTIIAVLALNYCMGQGTAQNTTHQTDTVVLKDTTVSSPPINYRVKQPKPMRVAPWYVEKFKISAGLYLSLNNTDIRVDNKSGTKGTDVDFENDLGFNKTSQTFLGDIQWRASSRSRFDLSYINLSRSSDYVLQKTIDFGDHTYDADANIHAFFNTTIYRFSYGYAIFSGATYEAGVLIGAHIVKGSLGLGLNGPNVSGAIQDDLGFTAPVPDLGLWGGFTLGPRWAVNGEFDYLSLDIDNISGRILGYNASVVFRAVKNLNFSLGYTGLNIKIGGTFNKFDGDFKWGYNGPTLTAAFSFGQKGWK